MEELRRPRRALLVVSGIIATAEDRRRFSDHLGQARLHLVLLRALPDTIAERVVSRREVEAQQQGLSLSVEVLHELNEYAVRSAQLAAFLDRAGIEDLIIDTDSAPPSTLADQVLSRIRLFR